MPVSPARASRLRVRAGLSIGEDNVLVSRVDLRQRRWQTAQADLCASNPSVNRVQRIHANSESTGVIGMGMVPALHERPARR